MGWAGWNRSGTRLPPLLQRLPPSPPRHRRPTALRPPTLREPALSRCPTALPGPGPVTREPAAGAAVFVRQVGHVGVVRVQPRGRGGVEGEVREGFPRVGAVPPGGGGWVSGLRRGERVDKVRRRTRRAGGRRWPCTRASSAGRGTCHTPHQHSSLLSMGKKEKEAQERKEGLTSPSRNPTRAPPLPAPTRAARSVPTRGGCSTGSPSARRGTLRCPGR